METLLYAASVPVVNHGKPLLESRRAGVIAPPEPPEFGLSAVDCGEMLKTPKHLYAASVERSGSLTL